MVAAVTFSLSVTVTISLFVTMAFSFAVAAFAIAVVAFAMVMAVPLSMAAVVPFLGGKILSVKPFCQFFFRCIADGKNLPGKVQFLSGHRVIEIEGDAVVFDIDNQGLEYIAVTSHHRNGPPDLHQILPDLSIDRKGRAGNIETHLLVIRAIPFFGGDGKGECSPFFEPFDFGFEFWNEHMGPVDIVQGTFFSSTVGKGSVYGKVVCDDHDFILFYFHVIR